MHSSEEHRLMAETARRFFTHFCAPNIDRWRERGYVDREVWEKAGELGLLGASLPVAYGGSGANLSFEAVVFLEQGRSGDISVGLSSHQVASRYIANFGTEDQRDRWLPGLITGRTIGAIAFTEPGGGTDLQAVKSTAIARGDYYLVNGSKTFISNGQLADLVILVAKTDPQQRSRGISLLIVEAGTEGFRRGRRLKKLGLDGQDTSELFFEDARVPIGNLLGKQEGQGFAQLMTELAWERLLMAITALGASECALRHTLAYVKERKIFGESLIKFQNTRFKLAEVKTKIELLRAFVDRCIASLVTDGLDPTTAAMAKWWGTQTQCEIADTCLQLHGGYGYMDEYPISRLFRDARVQPIAGGANEMMKELIARSLDFG